MFDARPIGSVRDFRVRSIRGAAGALALANLALSLVFLFTDAATAFDATIVVVAAAIHGAAWGTVGTRWEPSSRWALVYLAAITLLIAGALTTSVSVDTDGFWFFLIPVGLGGLVLRAREQLWLVVGSAIAYVVSMSLGAGVTAGVTAARIVALAAAGFVLWHVTRQLELALGSARSARADAEARGRAMAVVAASSDRLRALDADLVLASSIDVLAELGFDAAFVASQHDGEEGLRYGASVGLPAAVVGAGRPVEERMLIEAFGSGRARTWEGGDPDAPVFAQDAVHFVVVAPVLVHGEPLGVIGGARSYGPGPNDVETLTILAGQIGRSLEIARRFEEDLQTIDRLEELDRLKDEFVSTVSHELRTPLTAILGLAETVRRAGDRLDPDATQTLIERIEANAKSLDGIITSLLDVARLQRGTLDVRLETVDLADIVGRVVSRLEPLLARHDVTVHVDGRHPVVVDARLIDRVVENLVSNAARHTPAGTRVRVSVEDSAGDVLVRIADEGPGMTAADVAKLGERFFRGGQEGQRPTKGVGLGMALVTEVLKLLGSELEVDTAPGEGAVFAFRLQRATGAGPRGAITGSSDRPEAF